MAKTKAPKPPSDADFAKTKKAMRDIGKQFENLEGDVAAVAQAFSSIWIGEWCPPPISMRKTKRR